MTEVSNQMTIRFPVALLVLVACTGPVWATERLDPKLVAAPPTATRSAPVIVHLAGHQEAVECPNADFKTQARQSKQQLDSVITILNRSAGISEIRPFKLQSSFAATVTPEGLTTLLNRPEVEFIESDDRWPLHTAEGLDIIGATYLQLFGFTGSGAAVAIIDTGIDGYHPTLGSADIPNNKVVRGLDTADGDLDPTDCSGHGTAVASIAAGLSFRWSPERTFAGGAAPSAKIFVYKAASDSDCSVLIESAVIAAIEDAILHREGDDYSLAAINISGGGGLWDGPCDSIHPAISDAVAAANAAGIAVVASSGNSGSSLGVTAPACLENVIAVASVWDQDPTDTGSAFCLDSACAVTCNDRNKRATEPTCYSNTGRPLDLFAPSEYLTVAEAQGQFVSFGGTSGAAPYVTGAIAVLKRAFPRLPPEHIRLALAASGQRLTDPRNGLSRPVLNLVDAIEIDHLAFSETIGAQIPRTETAVFQSFATVEGVGPIGGIRVFFRLSYPDPSVLDITLFAPTGQSVRLQVADAPVGSEGGLFGCYPHDLIPADSLDTLIGSQRHGTWVLEIEYQDDGPHEATLESWALDFDDLVSPHTPPLAGAIMLPVAARGPGAANTHWTTDIRLLNTSRFNLAEGSLFYVPEGEDGTTTFIRRPLVVPAGVTIDLDDVVKRTFGLTAAAGQILVETGDRPLVVTGKIETRTETGSFGQFINSHQPRDSRSVVLLQLLSRPGYRTNLGISETFGARAAASVTLYDATSGFVLGHPLDLEIEPFSITRVDRLLETADTPQGIEAYAVVESDAQVLAWASVVDDRTGDAVFFPGLVPSPSVHFIVPVVARAPGLQGTRWRSDVRIASFADHPIELTLEMRPVGSTPAPVYSATTIVAPGAVATMDDVVGTAFGRETAIGSLRIVPSSATAKIAVVSRTYNVTTSGTFGQHIPAVISGLHDRATITHVDGSADYRTNLIVCEVGGQSLQLVFGLRDEHGLAIGDSHLITLGAFEMIQISDVFSATGATPQTNCRIDVQPVYGDGTFTALASVVDNHTGDAIAVTAVPLLD